jgi:type II secretory ATPase GspE/PulE/Tfp pilus assembly ATPase PilB-like protein
MQRGRQATQSADRSLFGAARLPIVHGEYTPTESELAWYAHVFGPPKARFVHGTGCNYCANTGFRERIGVYVP